MLSQELLERFPREEPGAPRVLEGPPDAILNAQSKKTKSDMSTTPTGTYSRRLTGPATSN